MNELPSHAPVPPKPHDPFGPVRQWSFSRLKNFEKCPRRVYQEKVVREAPLPPGEAAIRGTRLHLAIENYLKGDDGALEAEKDLKDVDYWKPRLDRMRSGFGVLSENRWAFNTDWSPVEWNAPDSWLRIIADAVFVEENEQGVPVPTVVDFKTGRSRGNTVTHARQVLLGACACLSWYPNASWFGTQVWYLDERNAICRKIPRDGVASLRSTFHGQGMALTSAREFPAKPSKSSCRFCDYRKTCPEAV